MPSHDYNTGIEIHDLLTSPEFQSRPAQTRGAMSQLAVLRRLSGVLTDFPDTVLQELVESACELCEADSAGIGMETYDVGGNPVFQWVALTGTYAPLREAMLPHTFMPCRVCIQTQRPQQVRVTAQYFRDLMGLNAAPISDGMLLPWSCDGQRATIWVVAHDREVAFDREDYDLLKIFADFAAVAYRQLQQNNRAIEAATALGAETMAHTLAHLIDNPLENLVNTLYLAAPGNPGSATHAQRATYEANQLSVMVKDLLSIHRNQTVQ